LGGGHGKGGSFTGYFERRVRFFIRRHVKEGSGNGGLSPKRPHWGTYRG